MAFPCPCCGSTIFPEPPGSNEVCAVCSWEDDPVQLRFPLMAGGANRQSLYASQRAFIAAHGIAKDRDPFWRPLDRRRDFVEPVSDDPDVDIGLTGPQNTEELYYWGSSYWLRRDQQRYFYGRYCPLPRQSFSESDVAPAKKQLTQALLERSLRDDTASNEALLSYAGKPLLHLAAFRQGELFGLDPRQQTYLQALWYAVTDHDMNVELVKGLAVAALAAE